MEGRKTKEELPTTGEAMSDDAKAGIWALALSGLLGLFAKGRKKNKEDKKENN